MRGTDSMVSGGGAGPSAQETDLGAALPNERFHLVRRRWPVGQLGEDLPTGSAGGGHATAVVAEDLDLAVGPVKLGEVRAAVVVAAQCVPARRAIVTRADPEPVDGYAKGRRISIVRSSRYSTSAGCPWPEGESQAASTTMIVDAACHRMLR
jgi:hypothetical protein